MNVLYYAKHLLSTATINKTRFILTSLGVFLAVFLFSTGMIISDSYYSERMRIVEEMDSSTAIISSNFDAITTTEKLNFSADASVIEVVETYQPLSIFSVTVDESRYFTLTANVFGVSGCDMIVPVETEMGTLPISTTLIKGRTISREDISEGRYVAVINELTEKLLFDGDGLGQIIELSNGAAGITIASNSPNDITESMFLEVVGVVKNSYADEISILKIQNDLNRPDKNVSASVSLYCPVTTIAEHYEGSCTAPIYYFHFSDHNKQNAFSNSLTQLIVANSNIRSNIRLITKKQMIEDITLDLANVRTVLKLVTLLLSIFSGMSIMSIIFFSIKERIPEIGIRKAFGATKFDVVIQFVVETVIIAFLASSLATILSCIVCKILENLLASELYLSLTIEYSIENILMPILVGVSEAIMCSIVPSIYAANIKVTDALKFE